MLEGVQSSIEGFVVSSVDKNGSTLYLDEDMWWRECRIEVAPIHSREFVDRLVEQEAIWRLFPKFIQSVRRSLEKGFELTGEREVFDVSKNSVEDPREPVVDGFIISCNKDGCTYHLNQRFQWWDYEDCPPFVHTDESLQRVRESVRDFVVQPQFIQSARWYPERASIEITGDVKEFPSLSVACNFEPKP